MDHSNPASRLPARYEPPSLKALLNRVEAELRVRHSSPKTIEAYTRWVTRYVEFHQRKSPAKLGPRDAASFLSHLATVERVSASTQNQALAGLLFLYGEVLGMPLGHLEGIAHAKRPKSLPIVLSQGEVTRLLDAMEGMNRLMGSLLYGGGLRLMECVQLRVKDFDFDAKQMLIRRGKGRKDRVTLLPTSLVAPLKEHLAKVADQHRRDVAHGSGFVALPDALRIKYPNAAREWPWQHHHDLHPRRRPRPAWGEESARYPLRNLRLLTGELALVAEAPHFVCHHVVLQTGNPHTRAEERRTCFMGSTG